MKASNKTTAAKKQYNKGNIMRRAWKLFRDEDKGYKTFGEALRASWSIEKNGVSMVDFHHIYNEHYNQILNFVNSKIGYKTEIAEEITQDVFVSASKHLDSYDVYRAKITTWLFTITNRKIIDYYRSVEHNQKDSKVNISDYTKDNGAESFEFISEHNEADAMVEGNELRDSIMNAFNDLKPKQKRIAELALLEQKSYNEIVDILDIPLSTVKVTLMRAKEKLQTILEGEKELMYS